MADAVTVAQCPTHPEAEAVGTCARCGRFACQACVAEDAPLVCADCAPAVTDPLGLKRRAFDPLSPIGHGLALAVRELPRLALISLIFAVPAGALQAQITGDDLGAIGQSWRVTSLYDTLVGVIGSMAMLALLIARAEGRQLALSAAFRESLWVWARVIGAWFRSGLQVLGFTLLLVVPGIWKGVLLLFVTVAALRTRDDALEVSERLVRGRWWPVFGFVVLAAVLLYLPAVALQVVASLALEALGAPRLVDEILSDWINRVALDGANAGIMLAAFYALHHTAGTALPPMRWVTNPALAPPTTR